MENFILHTGQHCPVPPMQLVIYRTIHGDLISHIHGRMEGGVMDWSTRPAIGRIYDYMCVNAQK